MKALRLPPIPRPTLVLRPYTRLPSHLRSVKSLERSFITIPTPPLQTLTASRHLPYPPRPIYTIIADVPSYASFLPYCISSTVTRWSTPDSAGTRWPTEAELRVGWEGIEEAFRSRVACVPGSVVESVAGGEDGGLFERLRSTWRVRASAGGDAPAAEAARRHGALRPAEYPAAASEVSLEIEFRFRNPLYSAMSSAVADRVASMLIEAFEKRVRSVLGPPRVADAKDWEEGTMKI